MWKKKSSEGSPVFKLCIGDSKQLSARSKKWEWLLPTSEGVFKLTSIDPGSGDTYQFENANAGLVYPIKIRWLNYSSLCYKLIDFALSCSQKGEFPSVCTVKLLICMVAVSESLETFWRRQGNQALQRELLQIHIGSNFAHSLLRPEQSAELRDTATFGWQIRKISLWGWGFASVADLILRSEPPGVLPPCNGHVCGSERKHVGWLTVK